MDIEFYAISLCLNSEPFILCCSDLVYPIPYHILSIPSHPNPYQFSPSHALPFHPTSHSIRLILSHPISHPIHPIPSHPTPYHILPIPSHSIQSYLFFLIPHYLILLYSIKSLWHNSKRSSLIEVQVGLKLTMDDIELLISLLLPPKWWYLQVFSTIFGLPQTFLDYTKFPYVHVHV